MSNGVKSYQQIVTLEATDQNHATMWNYTNDVVNSQPIFLDITIRAIKKVPLNKIEMLN